MRISVTWLATPVEKKENNRVASHSFTTGCPEAMCSNYCPAGCTAECTQHTAAERAHTGVFFYVEGGGGGGE